MHSRLIDEQAERTFVLVFDEGDEVNAELKAWCGQHNVVGARFNAIGAFREVVLGYFDFGKMDYKKIPLREQVEVLALTGNVALDEQDQLRVHAHVVLGTATGEARGGHLLEAHVRPTLELMLTETPRHLCRRYDRHTGLALLTA